MQGRERHLVRVVGRLAELTKSPDEDRAGGDEPAGKDDSERLQRDPEDMYLRLHRIPEVRGTRDDIAPAVRR